MRDLSLELLLMKHLVLFILDKYATLITWTRDDIVKSLKQIHKNTTLPTELYNPSDPDNPSPILDRLTTLLQELEEDTTTIGSWKEKIKTANGESLLDLPPDALNILKDTIKSLEK